MIDHVAAAHELAVEFFRGIYGEHAVVPKEKLYDLPAYPCWALACHAYEKLVGIDPERLRRGEWVDSYDFSIFEKREIQPGMNILGDQFVQLPADHINGQYAWQNHVIDNARSIERECQ